MEKNILNRVEINIIDNNHSQIHKFYHDWLALTQMKEEINIKPNVVEFDCLPGYKFYGLKQIKEEINENPLTFNFQCDKWEKH